MEIACVIDSRLAAPARPGRSGGPRPGRNSLADPVAAAERTEAMVRALEAIGAAVESEGSGEAFFAVDGLRGIHGERVDQGHLVGPGDLDQRQIGHVGALGVKLRVEAVRVLRRHFGDEILESCRVDDDGRRCSHLSLPAPDPLSGVLVVTAGEPVSEFPAPR